MQAPEEGTGPRGGGAIDEFLTSLRLFLCPPALIKPGSISVPSDDVLTLFKAFSIPCCSFLLPWFFSLIDNVKK